MTKLEKFDARFVTKTFFPSFRAADINTGRCFMWAFLAYKLFQDVELYDTDVHAFVKYNGKFYDSETHKGVKDWRKLPCHKLVKPSIDAQKHSLASYKYRWSNSCSAYVVGRWAELETKAKKVLKNDKTTLRISKKRSR